jgi:hypothetical protein
MQHGCCRLMQPSQHGSRVLPRLPCPVAPPACRRVPSRAAPSRRSSQAALRRPPRYNVLLHNDEHNRREYVVKVLLRVVDGMTVEDAVVVMQVGGPRMWISPASVRPPVLTRCGAAVPAGGLRPQQRRG